MNDELSPSMRASDDDREQVVEVLRAASESGRLTLEEFQERMAAAYAAKTHSELVPLTQDLPAASSPQPTTTPLPSSSTPGRRRWIVHVMGGGNSRGPYHHGDRITAVSIMGGGDIDLRTSDLRPGTVINVSMFSLMGGGAVIVPEGTRVEMSGFAFMGGRDNRVDDFGLPPDAPLVRVSIWAMMGGGEIKARP